MQTVMFSDTVFGPIHSRRLGTSLGVNLSPRDGKVCSFDCLYCEAGFNAQGPGTSGLPSRAETARLLEAKLKAMHDAGEKLDVITFSGNGEPTVNPDFPEIIDDTLALRDKYFPEVKVSVLTNSTMMHSDRVVEALRKVDNAILKLDSAIEDTMRMLDRPVSASFTVEKVIPQLARFGHQGIIQTMITRGSHDGVPVDNSTDTEIEALIEAYRIIKPREIMLYSLDRPTPETHLNKVPREELQAIARRITDATGIPVMVA
ncbi:MAG: radical SAM protein [Muribaculaceae bacterium]